MSETISTDPVAATTKTITERTRGAEIVTTFSADGSTAGYYCLVHRERTNEIPDQPTGISRDEIAAIAGPPANGTDGKQVADYTKSKKGFIPDFRVSLDELAAYGASKTVTVGSVTIPVNLMPALLQATFDFIAKKKKADAVDAAIAKAVAAAGG